MEDHIPVKWLMKMMEETHRLGDGEACETLKWVLDLWKKEGEKHG